MFFSYFGPSGILDSDKGKGTAWADTGAWGLWHFPLVLMNGLNKAESSVFLYCRFSVFLKDWFSRLFQYCW